MNRLLTCTGVLISCLCLTIACSSGVDALPTAPPPDFEVTVEAEGLSKPWDVVQAPDGAILTGERSGRFVVKKADGTVAEVEADMSDLYAQGETGLMGLELAHDFAQSRALYTCQGVLGGTLAAVSWDPGALGRAATASPSTGGRWTRTGRG